MTDLLLTPGGDLLAGLGHQLRAQRKAQKISATSAAQAAGLSRVTLYRIEQGEPSVAMGAYMNVAQALGLRVTLIDPRAALALPPLPPRIRLSDYPQLAQLAWQRQGDDVLSADEALNLYERNWRQVDEARLSEPERALLEALAARHAQGRLLT